jgi:membrane-bound lytic murein transglycosylase MltF
LRRSRWTNSTRCFSASAGYNAGPGKVAKLRKRAGEAGLDPNVWFRNVEIVAAERMGRETVQYVGNIYKYYTAYRLMVDKLKLRKKAQKPQPPKTPKK